MGQKCHFFVKKSDFFWKKRNSFFQKWVFFVFFVFFKINAGQKLWRQFFGSDHFLDQFLDPLFGENRVLAKNVVTSRKDFETWFLPKKGSQKVVSLFLPKNVIFGDSTPEKFLQTHFLTSDIYVILGHFLDHFLDQLLDPFCHFLWDTPWYGGLKLREGPKVGPKGGQKWPKIGHFWTPFLTNLRSD